MKKTISLCKVITSDQFDPKLLASQQNLFHSLRHHGRISLVLYDTVCNEATRVLTRTYQRYFPQLLQLEERPGSDMIDCINEFLDGNQGEIFHFSRFSTTFSIQSFHQALRGFTQWNVRQSAMISYLHGAGATRRLVPYKDKDIKIDLMVTPFLIQPSIESFFFDRELLGDLRLEKGMRQELSMERFRIRLSEKDPQYAYTSGKCHFYQAVNRDYYNYSAYYDKDFYLKETNGILKDFLLEKPDSLIRQASVMEAITARFCANLNERNKNILNEAEFLLFEQQVRELLLLLPDEVIVRTRWNHKHSLSRHISSYYMRLKYGEEKLDTRVCQLPERQEADKIFGLRGLSNKWAVSYRDICLEFFEEISFKIYLINETEKGLVFEGELIETYFADAEDICLNLCVEKRRIPAEFTGIYNRKRIFGHVFNHGKMVRVMLPKEVYAAAQPFSFWFEVEYQGHSEKINCQFPKFSSRFHKETRYAYWTYDHHLMQFRKSVNTFVSRPYSRLLHIKREILLLRAMLFAKDWPMKNRWFMLAVRMLYWLTRPLYKNKKVWVTYDQLFKGGDNGEYFYRYMRENHREIDMYYIINGDSREYPELRRKYGNVLRYGSVRCALMSLHADIIFSTRVGTNQYLGIRGKSKYYARDLFRAKVVCLQHGLTIQDIAQFQNRLFDNTVYYYCVSPREVANIQQTEYGYTEDMITLSGAPRYDGFREGTIKKQILISPTWRRNVTAGTNDKGKNNDYSVNFKNTVYFQIYNSLINDQRLIACAQQTGYHLIYLIHPILSPQIEDFDKNDYVDIIPGSQVSYESILKESALMVTDYSGVQFDFAYQKKPLVYYKPEELPPQYEEDDFGFGPECKTHQEVVDCLCRYMENGCQLEDSCREKIKAFFPYEDYDNCRRVYEATMQHFYSSDSI